MELFTSLIETVLSIFKTPFAIFGVTLSLWDVFLFCGIAGIVIWFLGEVFLGD